jgi:MFS family permease
MLSLAQLTTPLGVFVGYLIASECIYINENIGWKFSFIIQSFIILLMIYLFYKVSDKLFDSKYESYKDEIIDMNRTDFDDTFFKISDSIIIEQDTHLSDIINISYLKQIFSNKIYLLSIFSITCLYYSVTGVQYWGGDYMNRILKVHSPQKRLLYFSIICFTSPTIGVIVAGYMVKKIKDGYNSIKVFNICFVCSILTFISGFISAFVWKIYLFILFLWISFFFGGIIVPILTGIIITSLPQHLRASGNSLQLFFGTLFGYLPAPFIYGVLEDYFKDGGKRSYIFNMVFLFICLILLTNSKRIKEKNINENKSNNNNNDTEINTNIEINGQNYEEIPIQ